MYFNYKKNNENLLVLGASGLLGTYLLSGPYFQNYVCYSQGRGSDVNIQADLMDIKQVHEMILRSKPSIVINLVGIVNVDLCEQYPSEAFLVNVRSLQNVLKVIDKLQLKPRLVHISTDHVYDGIGPHIEDDVNLTNYYAYSKYIAELVAVASGGVVLRTNFFGKSLTDKRRSFSDWLFEKLKEEHQFEVIDDIFFSPLSLKSLCEVIEKVTESSIKGIFNIGTHDGLSKADFAYLFADFVDLPKNNMKSIKIKDANFLKTYRPKDMRMNVKSIEFELGIKLPKLITEIELVAREYTR